MERYFIILNALDYIVKFLATLLFLLNFASLPSSVVKAGSIRQNFLVIVFTCARASVYYDIEVENVSPESFGGLAILTIKVGFISAHIRLVPPPPPTR